MRSCIKLAIASNKFLRSIVRHNFLLSRDERRELLYDTLDRVAVLFKEVIDEAIEEYNRNNLSTAREMLREAGHILQYLTKELYGIGNCMHNEQYEHMLSLTDELDAALKRWMGEIYSIDMLLKQLRSMKVDG